MTAQTAYGLNLIIEARVLLLKSNWQTVLIDKKNLDKSRISRKNKILVHAVFPNKSWTGRTKTSHPDRVSYTDFQLANLLKLPTGNHLRGESRTWGKWGSRSPTLDLFLFVKLNISAPWPCGPRASVLVYNKSPHPPRPAELLPQIHQWLLCLRKRTRIRFRSFSHKNGDIKTKTQVFILFPSSSLWGVKWTVVWNHWLLRYMFRPFTGAHAIRSCFPAVQVIGTQMYFVYCFLLVLNRWYIYWVRIYYVFKHISCCAKQPLTKL